MSTSLPTAAATTAVPAQPSHAPAPSTVPAPLAALRVELDRIDTAIHDLLVQRSQVVADVAKLGAKGAVPLRAGREADIIRRLVRRHTGPLPRALIVRIWRELLAATTSMQGPYSVTVCDSGMAGEYTRLAREHFGGLIPLRVHGSPMQAISEISARTASVAVLPDPLEDEPASAAWWTALMHRDDPRIHVVARLPFWAPSGRAGNQTRAYVVAAVAPDASEHDHSLIGLELPLGMSRARFATEVATAGITQLRMLVRRAPNSDIAQVLMEVDGLFGDADPRLARLTGLPQPPVVLGGFAVPIEGDTP
jgi:chorismate mutase/prephenate dehydratase